MRWSLSRLCKSSSSFVESTIFTAPFALTSLLSNCRDSRHIYQIHGFMLHRALDQDNLLLSRFIDACSSLGLYLYAFSVFSNKTHPDLRLYNTAVKALSQTSSPINAISLYSRILIEGLRPDSYTIPFVLKAVVQLSVVEVGRQIHTQTVSSGLDTDVNVVTSLIQMYSSCGCVSDARKLFDLVDYKDVALWNAMVAGYVKVAELNSARKVFDKMPQRNVISWTALIAGYAQTNRPDAAIELFRKMQLEKVEPDEIAMLAVLSACADLGALELGEWIHNYIEKHSLCRIVPLYNALIDMYAKSGNIGRALEVFENMKHKSVITWSTMIAAMALHGLGGQAIDMFLRMEKARVRPNEVTFIAILSACSHVGMVDVGRYYFNRMQSVYKIQPRIEHYGCMIDLLARAGYLQEAQKLFQDMPFEANAAIWGSLLAASNTHRDADLAEQALRHLAKLEPENSGNYTLLSNTYAALGRWNESGMVRKVMRNAGVKKAPGGSFIEINNRVYEFLAGDRSDSQLHGIYPVLCNIIVQLKMAGSYPEEVSKFLNYDE
ncbi:pentatricopeptide repeat-containing protein At5g56310 [Cucurbita maxima]|uniref:Pentatricopeptide repeat-containing protein At5g56310 n=1 Tax=Cucurbita maxima TaxID=3661 RepID=A0A6J1JID8_CUCMA|nr:pentatricopeptide repeat-containing protein At5g56310 [Cucurbita maxima]